MGRLVGDDEKLPVNAIQTSECGRDLTCSPNPCRGCRSGSPLHRALLCSRSFEKSVVDRRWELEDRARGVPGEVVDVVEGDSDPARYGPRVSAVTCTMISSAAW